MDKEKMKLPKTNVDKLILLSKTSHTRRLGLFYSCVSLVVNNNLRRVMSNR